MQNILALDLSTCTGYAYISEEERLLGLWKMSCNPVKELRAARYSQFDEELSDFLNLHPVHYIAYEEVCHHTGVLAAHMYGYLEATVLKYAYFFEIPVLPVSVTTIKKFATGKGNALKSDMIKAAKETFAWDPTMIVRKKGLEVQVDSDDMADAACLAEYTLSFLQHPYAKKTLQAASKTRKSTKRIRPRGTDTSGT